MPWITVLRTSIALIAVFTLPGWFFLTFGAAWRQWRGLQRWIVAIGLSIAFYPVLFYWLRWMFPSWTMGPYKMGVLLAGFAALVAWRMHRHWRELLTFDGLEWLAIAVLGMTLFTRFWVIRDLPYPAWSDSLHHTLLTQLTAVQGRLPTTLEPYFPVALSDYHLGFYSLTATVEWLAQVPAHTALLWTAQVMSGLCGVGIYLVLDRKVGRLGAVFGVAVAGLLSHQPAFYVNWGRFTQLSSQVVLLIAWMVNWETLVLWKNAGPRDRPRLAWHALLAALLSGAVFLLHFLVALFYIPLLLLTVLWEMWQARRHNQTAAFISGTAMVGLLTLVVVAPAAWDAVRGFVMTRVKPVDVPAPTVRAIREQYFEFPWETVPILAARTWLLFVAALSAVFGICRRNGLLLLTVLWMIALYLIGDAYRLGMTWVVLSNLGAVLIMLYLPIGLLVGGAAEELCLLLGLPRRRAATRLVAALVLASGFVASHVRVTEIEPHRFFVTKEDVAAMEWIRDNTEPDALFAINTYFWLPHHPHGTDAGYWIPYFTGRQMTAAVMLLSGATPEYKSRIVELSEAEERLEYDTSALLELKALGVEYVYIGAKGDFSGPGLSAALLSQAQDATLVYQTPRVSIFRIGSPGQGP
jgi:hypothetical protein